MEKFSGIFGIINMFHVFAFTYYILLRCVTREYSMMSHSYEEKLFGLCDAQVHYYYSLLEWYMKHFFLAGLVTGDFFFLLIFLENLVIFCWGGKARGNVRKCWKFLEHLKDNFLGKFKKYFVHVVEKISENEYILEEVWRWF